MSAQDGQDRLGGLGGRAVVDADGEEVGRIDDVFVDDATDEPEWGLVSGEALGGRKVFVPLPTATLGDPIRLSVTRDVVEGAPSIGDDEDELSQDEEKRLAEHYGLRWTDVDSPSGIPVAGSPPGTVGAGDPVELSERDHEVHGRRDAVRRPSELRRGGLGRT